jgi:6-pyruvoyl-tetrahydropterin synthase
MTIDEFTEKLDHAVLNEFEAEFLLRVADKTPVVTGALKAGWFWDYADARNPVFSNTERYAIYVEEGTPKMAPRLMIGTTFLEVDDIMKVALQRAGL